MKRQSLHCILPPDLLGRLARASDEADDEAEVSDALRSVIETAMGHATLG